MKQKTKKSREELDRIEKILIEKYKKTTPTGRISTRYATNLHTFLYIIFSRGLEQSGDWFSSERTKRKALKDLESIGCNKEYMEKWHKIYKEENPPQEVIFVELNFDLNKQMPDGYEPPKSIYDDLFDEYLKSETKLKLIK